MAVRCFRRPTPGEVDPVRVHSTLVLPIKRSDDKNGDRQILSVFGHSELRPARGLHCQGRAFLVSSGDESAVLFFARSRSIAASIPITV